MSGITIWGCDFAEHDSEGRVWECLAPLDHPGEHFISQVSGPAYGPGDFGGMST